MKTELPVLTDSLRDEDVVAYSTLIEKTDFGRNLLMSMSTMGAASLSPNILFLTMPALGDTHREEELKLVIDRVQECKLGVVLFGDHKQTGLGKKSLLNIWVRDQSENWDVIQGMSIIDLTILLAYQIKRNWKGKISLLSAVQNAENIPAAEEYLKKLVDMARLPDCL